MAVLKKHVNGICYTSTGMHSAPYYVWINRDGYAGGYVTREGELKIVEGDEKAAQNFLSALGRKRGEQYG